MTHELDRRTLLAGGALAMAAVGASTVTGCSGAVERDDGRATPPLTPTATATFDPYDWQHVQAQFPLDPRLAQFAAFVLAAHPRPIRQAIDRVRMQLDQDTEATLATDQQRTAVVRTGIAHYLDVIPEEVALTDSTTMGLALTYRGLRLQPGDHVLTSTHDFYSTSESLRLAAGATGANVTQVPMYDDPARASAGLMTTRVRDAIRPETRLVALTWVHSSTGVRIPVRAIADVIAAINARRPSAQQILFCLDSVHGLGAVDATAPELGCDAMMSGTHKWIFGPRGTGFVWANATAADRLGPIIPTFETFSPFGPGFTPGGYKAFEHRWSVAAAFDFHRAIGKHRIASRVTEMATQLKSGVARLPHIRLITPRDPAISAGIVCCDVVGLPPEVVVARLRREHQIVASKTPYAVSYVRFGTSIAVNPSQVDHLVEALSTLR